MATRPRKVATALAAFMAFSFSQVYVLAGLPNAKAGAVPQRSITAVLRTRNNQPIKVNGNDAGTGQTILTGAVIETPDQTSGEIDLGNGSTVEIEPNSKIELAFDQDGNVRVKVLRGCAMLKRKSNVATDQGESEIFTESGDSVKTDKNRRNAGGCYLPNGRLGPFSAVAGAGAGAGGGLSGAAIAGIVAGAAGGTILAIALTRGGDSSPAR